MLAHGRTFELDGCQVWEVPLANEGSTLVEAGDLEHATRWKWFRSKAGYAMTRVQIDGRLKTVLLHRLIMGDPPGEVDHVNGKPLDNRRSNLRLATRSDNRQNQRRPNRNASVGVPGVSWVSARQKYKVTIHVNHVRHYLGLFETFDAAAVAAVEARRRLTPFAP